MKYLPALAACALMLLTSHPAHAEWVEVAEQDGKVYYLDAESKAPLGNNKYKAVAKTVFTNNPKVKEKKSDEEYDCTARTIKTRFVEVTVHTGTVVTQMLDATERPQPGSSGSMKVKYVCDADKVGE